VESIEQRDMITEVVSSKDLLARVEAQPGKFFVILDPVDEQRLIDKIQELGPAQAVSLWRDNAARDFWAISPYLVVLDGDLLQWLNQELWDHPWGVACEANSDLAELRMHFRRFLLVESPTGQALYFRFYDPRVLPNYLATTTPDEKKSFFGPVAKYFIPQPNQSWLSYSV